MHVCSYALSLSLCVFSFFSPKCSYFPGRGGGEGPGRGGMGVGEGMEQRYGSSFTRDEAPDGVPRRGSQSVPLPCSLACSFFLAFRIFLAFTLLPYRNASSFFYLYFSTLMSKVRECLTDLVTHSVSSRSPAKDIPGRSLVREFLNEHELLS